MTIKNGLDAERELDIFLNIEREKQIKMMGYLLEIEECFEEIVENVENNRYIHDVTADGMITSPDYEAIGVYVYDKLINDSEGKK